jgi:hypothetical protein
VVACIATALACRTTTGCLKAGAAKLCNLFSRRTRVKGALFRGEFSVRTYREWTWGSSCQALLGEGKSTPLFRCRGSIMRFAWAGDVTRTSQRATASTSDRSRMAYPMLNENAQPLV